MKKVYIAGPISPTKIGGEGVLEYLENINKGIALTTQALLAGYAPFSPFVDFLYFVHTRTPCTPENVEKIRGSSMEWLRVSDAILVLRPYKHSYGTRAEVREALRLGIPIFFSVPLMDLYFHFLGQGACEAEGIIDSANTLEGTDG